MADELDEVEDLDALEEDLDLEDAPDGELEGDDDDDGLDPVDVLGDDVLDDATVPISTVENADDDAEPEEEPEDEDVEASLDEILKERMVVIEEEPEEEDIVDLEDRADAAERVKPKQPDEFVCRSCFLVKHSSQLANKSKRLCRDCV